MVDRGHSMPFDEGSINHKDVFIHKDFIAKMAIASKEARETDYWIRLLIATGYLIEQRSAEKTLQNDCEELTKLLTSIVKTSQEN